MKFDLQLFGGGGSQQHTVQTQSTQQTSVTNADKTYNFNLSQTGLSPEQASALLQQTGGTPAQLYAALAGSQSAVANASNVAAPLVVVIILFLFAAIVFKR